MTILEHHISIMQTRSIQFIAIDYDGEIGSIGYSPETQRAAGNAGTRILGTVSLEDLETYMPCIRMLHVAEQHRNKGIGSMLLARCIAAACHAGKNRLQIQVETANEPAARLYRRRGFEAIGVNGRGRLELVMDLGSPVKHQAADDDPATDLFGDNASRTRLGRD